MQLHFREQAKLEGPLLSPRPPQHPYSQALGSFPPRHGGGWEEDNVHLSEASHYRMAASMVILVSDELVEKNLEAV